MNPIAGMGVTEFLGQEPTIVMSGGPDLGGNAPSSPAVTPKPQL